MKRRLTLVIDYDREPDRDYFENLMGILDNLVFGGQITRASVEDLTQLPTPHDYQSEDLLPLIKR